MLKVIDVRILYAFTFIFVVPPTLIINKKARNAIYNFYRKGFRYSRFKAAWMTYKNHCDFSEVVIDKFAMYAGKKFKLNIIRYHLFEDLLDKPEGFIQLSSHIGNFEIAGYSLESEKKRVNALVFGGEKASVMAHRNRMFESHNIRMIPVSTDMEHLFAMSNALDNGEIMSMPADRVFGSQKVFSIPFLGHDANFPQGPFILAAMKNVEVLFIAVMKTGAKKYDILIHSLKKPEKTRAKERAEEIAEDYVRNLQEVVEKYPTQWYNYFDFWAQ